MPEGRKLQLREVIGMLFCGGAFFATIQGARLYVPFILLVIGLILCYLDDIRTSSLYITVISHATRFLKFLGR